MGCSKGRGLFHQQRVSFRHCWVIRKATPGRRRLAPRPLPPPGLLRCSPSLGCDLDCPSLREVRVLGSEVFQPWGRARGRAGGCRERAGKGQNFASLTRCSGVRRVLQHPPARGCGERPPLRPTARPYGHRSHRERRPWFNILPYSIPLLLPAYSRWPSIVLELSFDFKCSSRRGVFTQGCVLPPFLMPSSPFLAVGYKMDGGMKDS